ncbi:MULTISPECIES: hypothetical protein [unclassified Streptomyces]|uniref:hypothetical protein n=1 Tax=unclassified Streptomyces TaxID=2593676 RepID=UPI003D7151A6
MTQPTPPPNQPADGNPYAQQQPQAPYGQQPAAGTPYPQQPGGAPYAPHPAPGNPFAQQPGGFPPPPAPGRNSMGLGILAAVAAAVVVAGVYGGIIGATKHEIGWAAVGVGFVVGLAAGKIGGRNPALPVIGAVLALGAVYLGQMVGEAILVTKEFPVSFNEVFFEHFGDLHKLWKEDADPLTFLFFALAGAAAFSAAKKAAA